jgi:hypothetical protein
MIPQLIPLLMEGYHGSHLSPFPASHPQGP